MAQIKTKILIVDDEPIKRSVLTDGLGSAGYSVVAAADAIEAERELAKNAFDIVLTDLRMPGQDGLTFLRNLKKEQPEMAVIVMTAYGSVETAVEAMKLGAFDYLQKPFSTEELLLKLDKLLEYGKLRRENETLRLQLAKLPTESRIVAESTSMRAIFTQIHAIAKTDATVLIEGESGVGKEMIAREIHASSHRCAGPFVPVSCAALPAELIESELFGYEAGAFTGAGKRRLGRFELANGGSLFLDDIDDIPRELQVKLVRVLQERAFERVGGETAVQANVRLLASTKVSLAALVAAGKFREDLFYRINVIPLRIPPLRERRDDIPPLVEHFLTQSCLKMNRGRIGMSPCGMARLKSHSWPGNVRELEHLIERMVALTPKDILDEGDIPDLSAAPDSSGAVVSVALEGLTHIDMTSILSDVEKRLVSWALDKANGNLAHAAELLGIPRSTLQYKTGKLVAAPKERTNQTVLSTDQRREAACDEYRLIG